MKTAAARILSDVNGLCVDSFGLLFSLASLVIAFVICFALTLAGKVISKSSPDPTRQDRGRADEPPPEST